MKILPQKLKNSGFFRDVFTLTAGTSLAQFITILLTPVLSRLYSPEDFAVFALFTSLVSQVSVIASLRLEMALPTIKQDWEAARLTKLAIKTSLWICLLAVLCISAYLLWIEKSENRLILLLAPLAILFSAINQILNFYSSRSKSFRVNSISRILLNLVTGLGSITLGFIGWGSHGLIIGNVVGLIIGSVVLWQPHKKAIQTAIEINKYPDKYYYNKFKQYIFINTPHAFVDTLELSGIILLLNQYYSDAEIGSYFFAYRLLKLPVSLIGAAVFQVFYQKMAEAKNEGNKVSPLIIEVYKKMAQIGTPVFLFIMLFASDFFPLIFGKDWQQAGSIASILPPWLLLNFIASSVSGATFIFNNQQSAFIISIIHFLLRAIAILILGKFLHFEAILMIHTVISSVIMIFAMWWYYRLAKNYEIVNIGN